jgi:hypothetical protein
VESVQGEWEGFWCVQDEGYYTRCITTAGEQWYRVADEASAPERLTGGGAGARVIPMRRRSVPQDGRRMLLLPPRYGDTGKAILVGTSRRNSGVRPRSTAEDVR